MSAFTATLTCYCLEGCVYLSAASYSGPETALLTPTLLMTDGDEMSVLLTRP